MQPTGRQFGGCVLYYSLGLGNLRPSDFELRFSLRLFGVKGLGSKAPKG